MLSKRLSPGIVFPVYLLMLLYISMDLFRIFFFFFLLFSLFSYCIYSILTQQSSKGKSLVVIPMLEWVINMYIK